MTVGLVLWLLLVLLLGWWLATLARLVKELRFLGRLGWSGQACRSSTRVAVVIPVRDEPQVSTLVNELSSRSSVDLIVVVDDHSREQMFSSLPPKTVYLRLEEEPRYWAPKARACWLGYLVAMASRPNGVVLFLDSDVTPPPDDLIQCMACMAQSGSCIVSAVPRFACETFRCRVAETVLSLASHAYLGLDLVSRGRGVAWFYGCCWAVHARVYEALGGHRGVRWSLVEDRDLATLARRHGVELVFLDSRHVLSTAWYPDLRGTVEALARIVAGSGAATVAVLVWLALANVLPLLLLAVEWRLALAVLALEVASYTLAARVNGYGLAHAVLAPFVAAVAYMATVIVSRSRGYVVWRGRRILVPPQ